MNLKIGQLIKITSTDQHQLTSSFKLFNYRFLTCAFKQIIFLVNVHMFGIKIYVIAYVELNINYLKKNHLENMHKFYVINKLIGLVKREFKIYLINKKRYKMNLRFLIINGS